MLGWVGLEVRLGDLVGYRFVGKGRALVLVVERRSQLVVDIRDLRRFGGTSPRSID